MVPVVISKLPDSRRSPRSVQGREDSLEVFSCGVKKRDAEVSRITVDSVPSPRTSNAVE